jgi:hypothetical protein
MTDNEEYSETIAIRVTPKTEEAVENYASEEGLSKSGASRKLLREGMKNERISPYMRRAGQQGGLIGTIIGILLAAIFGYIMAGGI